MFKVCLTAYTDTDCFAYILTQFFLKKKKKIGWDSFFMENQSNSMFMP